MKVKWIVKKIKCDGCVQTIAETLLLIDGLSNVTVDLNTKIVEFDSAEKGDVDSARQAMSKAGYTPEDLAA